MRADISRKTKTIGELKDQARLIATIPTDYEYVWGVACVGDAEAWICGNNRYIARIDIHGTVKDTVSTTGLLGVFGSDGIALTREGELIFSDPNLNTVKIVRHGSSETLITPQDGELGGALHKIWGHPYTHDKERIHEL